jgi:hypothetical protein
MPARTNTASRPHRSLPVLALSWPLLAGWLLSAGLHAPTTNPKVAQDLRRAPDAGMSWRHPGVKGDGGERRVRDRTPGIAVGGTPTPANKPKTNVTGEP